MSIGSCRQCAKTVHGTGEYVPVTCGNSFCQEAEYLANAARAKTRRTRKKKTS